MSDALVLPAPGCLVPDEKVLRMIEGCAFQLRQAESVPDVMVAIAQTEAIHLVARKIKVSEEVRRAAVVLRIQAEAQLGRITTKIPLSNGGGHRGHSKGTGKKAVLKANNIPNQRLIIAEKLGRISDEDLDSTVQGLTKPSLYAAACALGFRRPHENSKLRHGAAMKLARDAIGLLVKCQTVPRAPSAEEVDPLREAYTAIEAVTSVQATHEE